MPTTVITGDLHGRLDATRQLLQRIGMIACPSGDPFQDVRQPGFRHVQLGDSVSLGYGEVEAEFYRWLFDVVGVDEPLIGNHELPSVWWDRNAVRFQGYYDREEVRAGLDRDMPGRTLDERADEYAWEVGRDRDAETLVQGVFAQGRYRAAASVGEWLVTHAGLATEHERDLGLRGLPAADIAAHLNELFDTAMREQHAPPVIASTAQHDGGVMWLRIEHLRCGYDDDSRALPQVVGHSGYINEHRFGSRLWLIDTRLEGEDDGVSRCAGGVAALVTDDDGATMQLEVVRQQR